MVNEPFIFPLDHLTWTDYTPKGYSHDVGFIIEPGQKITG